MLEASKNHPYSLLIQMTAFYGLRRSEALGARWSRVDWEKKTILLDTKIIEYKENGKVIVKTVEEMKNKSSRRTILERLLIIKNELLTIFRFQRGKSYFCVLHNYLRKIKIPGHYKVITECTRHLIRYAVCKACALRSPNVTTLYLR